MSESLLSIWGAVVSTGLAGVKLWEIFRDRQRLSISYFFTSDPHRGNQIVISNPTKTPVMIEGWNLAWKKYKFFSLHSVDALTSYPEDGIAEITVPAYGRHTIDFTEQYYFEWGQSVRRLGKLYLVLNVVGRKKPLTLFVYNPSK